VEQRWPPLRRKVLDEWNNSWQAAVTKPLTGSERLSLKCGTKPTCSPPPPNKANSNADNEAFHAAEFARAENRASTRHLQFALGLSRALSRRARNLAPAGKLDRGTAPSLLRTALDVKGNFLRSFRCFCQQMTSLATRPSRCCWMARSRSSLSSIIPHQKCRWVPWQLAAAGFISEHTLALLPPLKWENGLQGCSGESSNLKPLLRGFPQLFSSWILHGIKKHF
jgi:hypothetical protein